MWIVLVKDVEQGDDYANGPFHDQQAACAWAAKDAEDRVGPNGRHLIDAGGEVHSPAGGVVLDGTFISIADPQNPDTDVSYEYHVLSLIAAGAVP